MASVYSWHCGHFSCTDLFLFTPESLNPSLWEEVGTLGFGKTDGWARRQSQPVKHIVCNFYVSQPVEEMSWQYKRKRTSQALTSHNVLCSADVLEIRQASTRSSWGPNCWNDSHLFLILQRRFHFPNFAEKKQLNCGKVGRSTGWGHASPGKWDYVTVLQ